MTAPRLTQLQSALCDFILHGRNQDALLEQIATPDRQQAVLRLDVYRNAYFIRLEAALAHDFPACERVLGQADFARQAGDYVVTQPSTSPSLRDLGDGFADWLRAHCTDAIGDLADIEWAAMRVFDGPNTVPAEASVMQAFGPDAWPTLYVELVPTLSLLILSSNADAVWRDQRGATELESTAPKPIAISRNEVFQPNLVSLDEGVFAALDSLHEEPSLAAVGEQLASVHDAQAVPELLAKALLTAFAHGWVADVRNEAEHEL